jgi:hypothetical protein
MALAIIVFILYQRSHDNGGLGLEASAMFGWKFIPTLIAVIYTQLTAMLFGAVKRTEPFSRLARSPGHIPAACYTLLEKSKPWWTTLSHGFQKKRNGGRWNWTMILSCMVYILAMLGISPISAALLGTMEIEKPNTETFKRLATHNNSALRPRAERNTYLRTMGAIFQNYSTSPWITDNYIILPFWPASSSRIDSAWDPLVQETHYWEANTTVFRDDFICTELHLRKKDIYLRHADRFETSYYNETYVASVLWESDNGCQFNLTVNATGGDYYDWHTQMSNYMASWGAIEDLPITCLNKECEEDEIIMMSSPWWHSAGIVPASLLDNFEIQAYACRSHQTMATIPVRVTGQSDGSSIHFDEDLFHSVHTPVPVSVFDTQALHKIYTNNDWYEHIAQRIEADQWRLEGPAAILGAKYKLNVSDMMSDPNIPTVAAQIRRRFFAEIIGASLQSSGASEEHDISGRRYVIDRYLLVSGQAASVLCALLVASFCFLLALLWSTHPTRRPLGIYRDPSTVLGTSIWAAGNMTVLDEFKTMDLATRKSLKEKLAGRTFLTESGKLREIEINDIGKPKGTYRSRSFFYT